MNRNVPYLLSGILLMFMLLNCSNGKKQPTKRKENVNTTQVIKNFNQQIADTIPQLSSTTNLNVYLENSGSMNGYVKGNTGFEQSIYYYLSQIEYSNKVGSIHLNYINSKVIPQGNDIESFIHNVEPADFQKKGGNLGSSDIAVILDTILNRQQPGDISLFISDCIFSPGKKMPDAEVQNYLIEQSTRIERIFKNKLRGTNNNLAVVICQLQSDFNGTFFNREDANRQIQHKRPFYFWLIGSPAQLCQLMKTIPFESLKGKGAEVENTYCLCKVSTPIKYAIINNGRIGTFERHRVIRNEQDKNSIFNCKPNSRGRQSSLFRFAIGVDYSALPLDNSLLLNPVNYTWEARGYDIDIKQESAPGGYTHLIYISTTRQPVPSVELEIVLKNPIPQWVEDKNDPVGLALNPDDIALDQTFGLKNLVKGVCDAFGGEQAEYANFKVSINKN